MMCTKYKPFIKPVLRICFSNGNVKGASMVVMGPASIEQTNNETHIPHTNPTLDSVSAFAADSIMRIDIINTESKNQKRHISSPLEPILMI